MNPQISSLPRAVTPRLIARLMGFPSPRSHGKRLLVSQHWFIMGKICLRMIVLSCIVRDRQMRPTPNDYKDLDTSRDRNVKVVDGALVIKNIQKSHEGYYLCKASNGIGGISAVAKIAVQGGTFCGSCLLLCFLNCFFLFSPSFVRDQEAYPDRTHFREHRPPVRGQGREANRDTVEHEQQAARRKR